MRAAYRRARVFNDTQMKAFFEVSPVELIDCLVDHFHPTNIETVAVSFEQILRVCDEKYGVRESRRFAALTFGNRIFVRAKKHLIYGSAISNVGQLAVILASMPTSPLSIS